MDDTTTYDVRIYKTVVYKGTRVTTYYVRWKAGDGEWREPFRTVALSDSLRPELLTCTRKGEAFCGTTGQPAAWKRDRLEEPGLSWLDQWVAVTSDAVTLQLTRHLRRWLVRPPAVLRPSSRLG